MNRLYQVLGDGKEGVQCYWMHIPPDWLEFVGEEDGARCFKVKQGYGVGPDTLDIIFLFLKDAVLAKDILVTAAIGLLLVKAATEGIIEIKM